MQEVKIMEDINQFRNTQDLAEAFTCPITQQIIKEPVSSKFGHLYEKEAIEDWISKHHTCPLTNQKLELNELFPQYAVKTAIQQYIKLNESIVSGRLQIDKSTCRVVEESKDEVVDEVKMMNMTMSKLRKDYFKQHEDEVVGLIDQKAEEWQMPNEDKLALLGSFKGYP